MRLAVTSVDTRKNKPAVTSVVKSPFFAPGQYIACEHGAPLLRWHVPYDAASGRGTNACASSATAARGASSKMPPAPTTISEPTSRNALAFAAVAVGSAV